MEPASETLAQRASRQLSRCCGRLMVGLIDAYRFFLSPLVGQQCRFHPSCSLYSREAIIRHGPLRGIRLTLARLLRCHPWCEGGHDPVPELHHHATPRSTTSPDLSA